MEEIIDFKCLKEEQYNAINETIRDEIVSVDRDLASILVGLIH
jgi:hypothetical protein